MRLDAPSFGVGVWIIASLLTAGVLYGINAWWFEITYSQWKLWTFAVGVGCGILAYLVRRALP